MPARNVRWMVLVCTCIIVIDGVLILVFGV